MSVTYGHDIAPNASDKYVDLARRAMESLSAIVSPGAFYVDIFPSCMCYFTLSISKINTEICTIPTVMYIPEWMMPSWAFKKKASLWRPDIINFKEKPYAMVRERIVSVLLYSSPQLRR
jgi:hypothetical protein